MGDLTESSPVPAPPSLTPRVMPVREDCWSEDATATLIDAWGRRFLELNRGNLRQKDWQEVADAVNSLHGHTKKTYRTDVQCKNRIDTVKKKYKIEKARVSSSNGAFTSSWVFYDRLDSLIGTMTGSSSGSAKRPASSPISPPVALPLPYKKSNIGNTPSPVMATAIDLPQKRPLALPMPVSEKVDGGYFRRNYSEIAAAAAAAADDVEEDEEERESDEEDEDVEAAAEERESEEDEGEGMRRLAKAIERFGEVYQRVEAEKMRQMVELEKQRMEFAKDLEVQRLKMLMDTQVQLERLKHGKRSASNDMYD